MTNSTFISVQAKHSRDRLFSGKIFPCGDFSFGVVPTSKKAPRDADFDRAYKSETPDHQQYHYYSYEGTTAKTVNLNYKGDNPLISTLLPNCRKSQNRTSRLRERYGSKGITGYGRKMVKSGCKLLEDKHGRSKLGFLTCTLPGWKGGLNNSDLLALSMNWGNLVRRFLENLTRELVRKGADPQIVASTEIQEKRFKATGVPALHLHCVFNAHDGKTLTKKGRYAWYLPVSLIRYYWQKAIANILKRSPSSINCLASINVKRIKKSAVGYVGKYLSKGAKITKEVIEAGKEIYLPKQWWTLYGGLRETVKRGIVDLSSDDCLEILANRDQWQEGDILHKFYSVEAQINGKDVLIGYSGSFTPWGYILFLLNLSERENSAYMGVDSA